MPEKRNQEEEKKTGRQEGTACLYLKAQSIRYTRALVAQASGKKSLYVSNQPMTDLT